MRGSWRPTVLLVALSAAFLAALALQRSRSGFLAAEARADEARALSIEHGLDLREVLALHELFGGRLSPEDLASKAEAFASGVRELQDPLLAVLVVRGKRPLALELHAAAGGDSEEVRRLVFATRAAVEDGVRFASVVDRFASRGF